MPFGRFDRRHHNRADVAITIASAAGSAAWSLVGRGAVPPPGAVPEWPRQIGRVDLAIPSLYRN